MSEEILFRRATFGGFNRDDVMQYISSMSLEAGDKEKVEKELSKAKTELSALKESTASKDEAVNRLKTENEMLKAEAKTKDVKISSLESEIELKNTRMLSMQIELEAAKKTASEAIEAAEAAETAKAQAVTAENAQAESVPSEALEAAKAEIEAAKAEAENAKAEAEALKAELEAIKEAANAVIAKPAEPEESEAEVEAEPVRAPVNEDRKDESAFSAERLMQDSMAYAERYIQSAGLVANNIKKGTLERLYTASNQLNQMKETAAQLAVSSEKFNLILDKLTADVNEAAKGFEQNDRKDDIQIKTEE